ncbi:MAG: BON domain-containing protein [Minicystis sp.]
MSSKRFFALGVVLGLYSLGCDKTPTDTHTSVASTPADNSKKNERDRNSNTVTPMDQGENDLDRGITQKIRQEVIKADGLSMNAKNVKIITNNAVVTLRGPVSNDQERTQIVAIATRVDGVKRVDNQIEIAAN